MTQSTSTSQSKAFKDFQNKLLEMFQLDQSKLDFGIYRIMNAKRDEINEYLNKELYTQVGEVLQKYSGKDKKEELTTLKKSFVDDFAEARRMLEEELRDRGAETLDIEEFHQLKKKVATATQMLTELNKQKKRRNTVSDTLLTQLSRLNDLWLEEYRKVRKELEIVNRDSTALHIDVEFKGDAESFFSFMKSIFQRSKIHSRTFEALVTEYPDFIDMYKDLDKAASKAGSSFNTFKNFFLENLKTLLTYQVPNKFIIKYRGKALEHHSLGQRSSALILFVLNQQEHEVAVIDQPEDDLDNQTIYEDVIKLIREIKPRVQYIFATHNANIPVLGDAEQIQSCHYEDDQASIKSGSVDLAQMQKDVVAIMEGGRDAFRRRKEIYQLWKLPNS